MKLTIYEIFDTKLLLDNAGTVAEHDLKFGNAADFQPDEKTISIEGDGQTKTIYLQSGLTIEVTADNWSVDALDALYGDTAVSTGLPTGIASRRYYGQQHQTGRKAGIKCQAMAIDEDSGLTHVVYVVAPVGTVSAVAAPSLKSADKAQMKLKFSAEQTTKDIAGDALPGLEAGEVTTWYLDVATAN